MADDLPVLPGFREMAERARADTADRRALVADLVAHRRAAGLSQGDVAERMGTSQPAVARLEAGQVDARMSTVQRYAAAVGARLNVGAPRNAPPTGEDRHA
jgi:transcriptional regulator with XRE-family HTH domain